jgi:hypothetical protein
LCFPPSIAGLATQEAFASRLATLRRTEWVVFAKPPFATPDHVLAYLGRYTHRVAIANSRLVELADGKVRFTWEDYRDDGKTKIMTLGADEFIRRFLQHTVPSGFRRIRCFDFLANGHRAAKLALFRRLLAIPSPPSPPKDVDHRERHPSMPIRIRAYLPKREILAQELRKPEIAVERVIATVRGCQQCQALAAPGRWPKAKLYTVGISVQTRPRG